LTPARVVATLTEELTALVSASTRGIEYIMKRPPPNTSESHYLKIVLAGIESVTTDFKSAFETGVGSSFSSRAVYRSYSMR
jgi:hypothetical protein